MSWQGLHKSKYENGIFVKENKKIKWKKREKESDRKRFVINKSKGQTNSYVLCHTS